MNINADDILEGASRALFLSAYADAAEEMMCPACGGAEPDCEPDCSDVDRVLEYVPRYDLDCAGPGEDWDDVAPETPISARISARRLLDRVAGYGVTCRSDVLLQKLCAEWMQAGGDDEENFGHCLAMQALGHGVGLIDDVRPDADYVCPDLPSCEATYIDGDFWFYI